MLNGVFVIFAPSPPFGGKFETTGLTGGYSAKKSGALAHAAKKGDKGGFPLQGHYSIAIDFLLSGFFSSFLGRVTVSTPLSYFALIASSSVSPI